MSNLISRYRVQRFLEIVRPLEDSVMREICTSHNLLLDRRSELRYSCQMALTQFKAMRNGDFAPTTLNGMVNLLESLLEKEELLDVGVEDAW